MRAIVDFSGVILYILGAISGYAVVRYRLTVSDRASQISDHLRDLEKLHDAAIAFWSNPFEKDRGSEKQVKVLSSHAISMRIYPAILLMALHNSRRYEELISEYFRACTGGDFDNPDRAADMKKALELSGIHAQLVEVLRQIRRDLSSLSLLRRDFVMFSKRACLGFHDTFLIP